VKHEQLELFPPSVGTEGRAPGVSETREYRRSLGRDNVAATNWRRRRGDFERGVRKDEPIGFGGLDDPYARRYQSGVSPDIVPMASQEAQDSYWSENIHPGSEAARHRNAMANLDAPLPAGPEKWPRDHSREWVQPSDLSTVQFEGVYPTRVDQMRGSQSLPAVHVEERAGENVVVDGNHRVAEALSSGRLLMEADVYRPKMGPHRPYEDERYL
jgi:hypothetical protein